MRIFIFVLQSLNNPVSFIWIEKDCLYFHFNLKVLSKIRRASFFISFDVTSKLYNRLFITS